MSALRKGEHNMKKDIVILYSGGMDSTTALYEYANDIRLAVSFDYGSKHNAKEIEYARKNCELLGIEHRIVNIDFNELGFKSDLLKSGGDIPNGHYESETMKKTVVPFRNGIMLSIVTGIAESHDCKRLLISNHAGDHAIYPDCRANFIDSMNEAIAYGTYNNINIFAPYTHLSKREIALRGLNIKVPYGYSYSCYNGGDLHCGTCGTCTERKEALQGFDKTAYLT